MRRCSIEGCTRGGRFVRGWCEAHYKRWRKYGDPLGGGTVRAVRGTVEPWLREFLADPGDGCRTDWPFALSDGYPMMHWRGAGRKVAHVVCELTYGPAPDGKVACHGPCNNPLCIQPAHLSWGTHVENEADKLRDGTRRLGQTVHNAVLTDADVLAMVAALDSGATQKSLAAEYGVSKTTVSAIACGQNWAWLTGR